MSDAIATGRAGIARWRSRGRDRRPCITSSFQAECVVLTHMLLRSRAGHSGAVPRYRSSFRRDLHVSRRDGRRVETESGQPARRGAEARPLAGRAPTTCCARHKVGPLFSALERYDVWFTALRREQSPSRANLQEVEPFRLPSGKVIQRVSPLASWTARDVWTYAKAHAIPLLPLYEVGYTSIGCEPCTTLPLDPDNPALGPLAGPEARMRDPYSGEVKTQITNPKSQTPSPMSFVAWDSGFGSWDLGFTS